MRGREHGVTLIELLITSALAGVVVGMTAVFYIGAWRNFTDAAGRAERLGRLAGATTALAADVRAARVVVVGPGRLDLWAADRNADGYAQADEIVGYRVEPSGPGANRLVREDRGGRMILVDGLGTVAFAADEPPPNAGVVWVSITFPDGLPIVMTVAVRNAAEAGL